MKLRKPQTPVKKVEQKDVSLKKTQETPNNFLKIKFKKIVPHAFTPTYAYTDDAGLDFRSIDVNTDIHNKYMEFGTGLAVYIPAGYVGLLLPRSSISKTCHNLTNSVGIIDSGYTGEIKFRFRYDETKPSLQYRVGDKIGQMIVVPYPKIKLEEVSELPESERSNKGFGSTGV